MALVLGLLGALTGCDGGEGDGPSALLRADLGAAPSAWEAALATGVLSIEQVGLPGSSMAESGLVVGPDGTTVLIDVGSDRRAAEVLSTLEARTGGRAVDWVVLTHLHRDHLGGFADLFTPSTLNQNRPVVIRRGVIWRGPFGVGSDLAVETEFSAVCRWAANPSHRSLRYELCEGPARAPCGEIDAFAPWSARSCLGLRKGRLDDQSDDAQNRLSSISLGDGASLTFLAVDGVVASGGGFIDLKRDGLDLDVGGIGGENSRSLVGVIRWGTFSYVFAGDLTGGGKPNAPDVESRIAALGPTIVDRPGGALLIPRGSVDLLHLNHHGTSSSTNQAWVDWLLPDDGQSRNALAGANNGYWGAPAQKVLDRVLPRLGHGAAWMTDVSLGAGSGPRLKNVSGSVGVVVRKSGGRYRMGALVDAADAPWEEYVSTVP